MKQKMVVFFLIAAVLVALKPGRSSLYQEHRPDASLHDPGHHLFATTADSLLYQQELQHNLLRSGEGWYLPHAGLVDVAPVQQKTGNRQTLVDPGGRFLVLYDFQLERNYRFVVDSGRWWL